MLNRILGLFKSDELRGKAARGGLVLSGASLFEFGARFVRQVILTRLLFPDSFGFMMTIAGVVQLSEAFTEVGVRQAVIQNKSGGARDFLNVAWWFSAIRGLVLYGAAFLAAPLFCRFYESPALLDPMRVAFLALLLHGLVSTRMHVLEKELHYLKFVVMKQGAAILNVATAVVLSIFFKNVWPLVIGFVVEYAGTCILSFILVPIKPRFNIGREYLGDIFQFARRMFGLPLLTSLYLQFDVMLVPKFFTWDEAGMYAVARTLALMPVLAFNRTILPLILPVFSKLQDSTERLKEAILKMSDLTAVAGIPFVAFCIVFSENLLTCLYPQKYGAVAVPFSILMVYVLIRLLSPILMQLYFVLARPDLQRWFALVRLVITAAVFYPAVKYFDLPGAAMAVVVGMLSLLAMQIICACRLVGFRISEYCLCLMRGTVYGGVVFLAGTIIRNFVEGPDLVVLVLGGLVCLAVWGVAMSTSHYRMIVLGNRT